MEQTKAKFIVTENCEACGTCYTRYKDYFSELEDGKAEAKNVVFSMAQEELIKILEECPCKALKSVEVKESAKQRLLVELEKLKNYQMKYPTNSQVKFKKEEYYIPLPYASGEHRYDYSSESSANSAARNEFNQRMYSQIDVLILKVITEYRIKYFKPYYTKTEEEGSAYLKCNKEISDILAGIENILKEENAAGDISKDFKRIEVFPENDTTWKMLNKGELIADEMISSIRSEFNSQSYSSLSSYESYWDTDDMEVSVGRGKYKDRYCYRNLHEAFRELASDILSACYYKDHYIERRGIEVATWVIDTYNKILKQELSSRISYIEKKIAQLS